MSAKATLTLKYEPSYFHREYKNDVGEQLSQHSWGEQGKRIALVALPFVSLYKPVSFHMALGLGSLRTLSSVTQLAHTILEGNNQDISYQLLQTAVSTISLSSTIFAHPVGILLTTGQDLIIELTNLAGHLQAEEYDLAMESCANIVNNALYLALFFNGGLELSIASLVMQIMLGLYHSQAEFQKGNNLEAGGHLLMAMIRGNQLAQQAKKLNFQWEIKSVLKKINHTMQSQLKRSYNLTPEAIFTIDPEAVNNFAKNNTTPTMGKETGSNITSSMSPDDLSKIIKLPFFGPTKFAFKIAETNNRGESVGQAFFSDNNLSTSIAWYWSPQTGFDIIASKEILISHSNEIHDYFYNNQKFPACSFRGLRINNNGVVAGSGRLFYNKSKIPGLTDPSPPPDREYFWFWWSKDQGLHTSSLMNIPTVIADINDYENVLLNRPSSSNPHAIITSAYDMQRARMIEFPITEIEKAVKKWLIEHSLNPHNCIPDSGIINVLSKLDLLETRGIKGYIADSLLEDGTVRGTAGGWCSLHSKELGRERSWEPIYLEVNFTIGNPATISVRKL